MNQDPSTAQRIRASREISEDEDEEGNNSDCSQDSDKTIKAPSTRRSTSANEMFEADDVASDTESRDPDQDGDSDNDGGLDASQVEDQTAADEEESIVQVPPTNGDQQDQLDEGEPHGSSTRTPRSESSTIKVDSESHQETPKSNPIAAANYQSLQDDDKQFAREPHQEEIFQRDMGQQSRFSNANNPLPETEALLAPISPKTRQRRLNPKIDFPRSFKRTRQNEATMPFYSTAELNVDKIDKEHFPFVSGCNTLPRVKHGSGLNNQFGSNPSTMGNRSRDRESVVWGKGCVGRVGRVAGGRGF